MKPRNFPARKLYRQLGLKPGQQPTQEQQLQLIGARQTRTKKDRRNRAKVTV
jgi:hypothetical protein